MNDDYIKDFLQELENDEFKPNQNSNNKFN